MVGRGVVVGAAVVVVVFVMVDVACDVATAVGRGVQPTSGTTTTTNMAQQARDKEFPTVIDPIVPGYRRGFDPWNLDHAMPLNIHSRVIDRHHHLESYEPLAGIHHDNRSDQALYSQRQKRTSPTGG